MEQLADGMRVHHPDRGAGVLQIDMNDPRNRPYIVSFDSGDCHHYSRTSAATKLLPIITIVALNLGFTVSGAVQIEAVFSWPGLGQAIFESVARRDYPVLQGAFLLLAVSVIVANLLADLLYSWLDPRVQAAL